MESAAALAALAALAWKITSLVKYLSAGQVRQAVTTVVPWVAAFVALLIGAQADATAAVVLPSVHVSLGDMDVASMLLLAATTGALGSTFYDVKTALDNTDSAAEPQLLPPSS